MRPARPKARGWARRWRAGRCRSRNRTPALMPSWVRKYRLSRRPASSSATVVRCRSLEPQSRISRSRKSSCCKSTKIATTKTIPPVANGARMGERTSCAICSGEGDGGCTCTVTGLFPGAGRLVEFVACCRWPPKRSSRSVRRPIVRPCTVVSLVSTVAWYCGRLVARLATCEPISPARARTTPNDSTTDNITAATRGSRMRRRRPTNGANKNDSSTARVIGSMTSRAK